ncbi:SecDF P1 head subdomain-containing protein [Rubrivirga sp.]|uniref:SecDF P1 head subdomain-containing protein n=1 Tax=Rubrivirga sp. TaxID=1885344 RepID=UPI003B52709D
MTRLALAVGLAVLALAVPAEAQLRLHLAVTPDAPGDTTGLRRHLDPSGAAVYVGEAVLEVPASSVVTVGLEEDADGVAAVSVWLDEASALVLSRVTTAATGRALAVLHDGRVLSSARVEGVVANGLVQIAGLPAADAERLARALRGPTVATATPRAPRPVAPSAPPADPPAPPAAGSDEADRAALAFVDALRRRAWAEAADALHPSAQAAVRPDALGLLRLDGPTVRVRDGLQEGDFPLAEVGVADVRSLDALGDRDLAALYLAGLGAIGVWPPGRPATVVGRVADGADAHVILQREGGAEAGLSEVTVVTVRRDASGRWRALLTEARGY